MSTAFKTTLAAAGMAAALLAAPAMAQMPQAEQQRIIRSLAGQGYSRVRISELDHDVTVLAFRGGRTQSFAYDTGTGRLVRVGNVDDDRRQAGKDRSGDRNDDGHGRGTHDGGGYGEGGADYD